MILKILKFSSLLFVFLCCLSVSSFSGDDAAGSGSFVSPVSGLPFLRPYVFPAEILAPGKIDFVERFNSGALRNSGVGGECHPIQSLYYEGGYIVFCVAGWAGNYLDIWLVFYDSAEKSFSKPFFSGVAVQYLLDRKYHSDLQRSVKLESVEWRVDADLVTIGTKYFVAGSERRGEQVTTLDLRQITSDQDNDGLSYYLERRLGSSPIKEDTDGDGLSDIIDSNPAYPANNDSDICAVYNLLIAGKSIFARNDAPVFYTVKYKDESNCSIDKKNAVIINRGEKAIYEIPVITFSRPKIVSDDEMWITVKSDYGPKSKSEVRYRIIKIENEWRIKGRKNVGGVE